MIKLNAIFLSRTSSQEIYKMTMDCINSLVSSEKNNCNVTIKYILIESNKDYYNEGYHYPDFVTVIIPEQAFNFHLFLNIGIRSDSADYYALCNNDIIFEPDWFSEILRVADKNPKINSFSPIDYDSTKLSADEQRSPKSYFLGYESGRHVSGWCIVLRHELLNIIGMLDEKFDFYYADDDYGMTLRHYNQYHAIVLQSRAKHLEGVVTVSKENESKKAPKVSTDEIVSGNIPWYLKFNRNQWIVNNKKMLEGHMKFCSKWGDYELLRVKKIIHNFIMRLGGNKFLSKILISSKQ